MIAFLENISAVSKYETKLLTRSWFFKVFSALVLLACPIIASVVLWNQSEGVASITSMVPYGFMLIINVGQAVVSIFLASEYLKRDKQLDTSEVFYTRPLSNAEYLLGKMWATLKVFFTLDLIVLAIAMTISMVTRGFKLDYLSYLWYFLLLCVPTLVYIVGLSTTLMLIIKNQALTFVILLAYIGATLFYIDDLYYYLFDYIGFNLPMFKSTVTGFGNLPQLISHRMCYMLLGLGLIIAGVSFFRRLPNSRHSLLPWRLLASFLLLSGLYAGFNHVRDHKVGEREQAAMIELNNKYIHSPKVEVDTCSLEVVQHGARLDINVTMEVRPIQTSNEFTFALNPGYEVEEVTSQGEPLKFRRERHLLFVDFGRELEQDRGVELSIKYGGVASDIICYLDIPGEEKLENVKMGGNLVTLSKQYLFQTANYILLTPESYWYPRPGVGFSNESPEWQQSFFTYYNVKVTPERGLTPITQGAPELCADSVSTFFKGDMPMLSASLLIGTYEQKSLEVDSVTLSLFLLGNYDYGLAELDTIMDTIPTFLADVLRQYENNMELEFPFSRFGLVEVPAHFAYYQRSWSSLQDVLQPEMALVGERACRMRELDLKNMVKTMNLYERRWNNRNQTSLREQLLNQVSSVVYFMYNRMETSYERGAGSSWGAVQKPNPYYMRSLMYNLKYNVYSSDWPVANRLVDLLLGPDQSNSNNWYRETNGMSDNEKAMQLLPHHTFRELLADPERRNLVNSIITLKTEELFAPARASMGYEAFIDSLDAYVKLHEFKNLSFEALLDYMGELSGTDITGRLEHWNDPVKPSEYVLGDPVITNVTTDEKEVYQMEVSVENISDNPGYVDVTLQGYQSDETKPTRFMVYLEPHQAKRLVSHWEESQPWGAVVNTLLSNNLPAQVNLSLNSVEKGSILTPEGETVIPGGIGKDDSEIVVDNEDKELFSISKPISSGYINKWLDSRNKDDEMKYEGFSQWRAPFKWTAVTDARFYGLAIRSGLMIKSGDGSQWASWKVPVTEAGTYDVYYYLVKPSRGNVSYNRGGNGRRNQNQNQGKRVDEAYLFDLTQGGNSDFVSLNVRWANDDGWCELGTFNYEADTVTVRLSNKSGSNVVIADAVKFVKR